MSRRRTILKAGIGWGVQLVLAGIARAQETPASISPKEGDLLVKVDDHKTPRSGERLNRMLPALPLKIVEKKLVVAGPFTARIYFEKD